MIVVNEAEKLSIFIQPIIKGKVRLGPLYKPMLWDWITESTCKAPLTRCHVDLV